MGCECSCPYVRQSTVKAIILAVCIIGLAAAEERQDCGQQGKTCCCSGTDWQNPKCCGSGLQCTMFGGQGFGTPPVIQSLCLPAATPNSRSAPEGCGTDGGPCCISTARDGYAAASCGSGLVCIPSSYGWASKSHYTQLTDAYRIAVKNPAVMGTCRKVTSADCGKAFMPCGKDIAAVGLSCPGNPAKCPSGFYCAAKFDAGVGERCIRLPEGAGTVGGPCLPNNLPGAPIVKFSGVETAPNFCTGAATCFTGVAGDVTGFTHNQPTEAKSLASRISGSKCLNVPSDCGSAPGKPCCPSNYKVVTDRPLPSHGTSWSGSPCRSTATSYGMYCSGNYVPLAGQAMGTCTANSQCGGDGQPCCSYSKPAMGGVDCPGLGDGKGYCNLQNKCRTCPVVLWMLEDILRCY